MRTKFLFYVCATITCINALVSVGFSLAMVIGQPLAVVAAMYGVARTVPLAIAALAVAIRSYSGITVLALLLAAIQACDAIVGWISHDAMKTIGPATLTVLTITSAIILVRAIRQDVLRPGNVRRLKRTYANGTVLPGFLAARWRRGAAIVVRPKHLLGSRNGAQTSRSLLATGCFRGRLGVQSQRERKFTTPVDQAV
jgi:hypothetical protein